MSDKEPRQRSLLFRCDASVATGTGHVMRCLALAQAWQDTGGHAIFAMAGTTPAIEQRLRSESVRLVRMNGPVGSGTDASQLLILAREQNPAWVIVDGYEFSGDYLRSLRHAGVKVLLIDDNGKLGTYACDLVLNQNLHASEDLYHARGPKVHLLLGPRYALLRREFVQGRFERKVPPVAHQLLVSMGGSDPDNVTPRVLAALENLNIPQMEVAVIAGGSNPHAELVAAACASLKHSCRVLNDVANMQEVISWADLAVSAAGSVFWEYCALGLPALLVTVAENQIPNACALRDAGAAKLLERGSGFDIGEMSRAIAYLAGSATERRVLSETASTLVDGLGASRVLSAMFENTSTPEGNA